MRAISRISSTRSRYSSGTGTVGVGAIVTASDGETDIGAETRIEIDTMRALVSAFRQNKICGSESKMTLLKRISGRISGCSTIPAYQQ